MVLNSHAKKVQFKWPVLSLFKKFSGEFLWVLHCSFQLIRIGNNVIIDNGLNYGISSLIGSAIRDEQLYTSEFSKSANASIAQTQLIGVVPRSMLSSSKQSQATKVL